MATVQETGIKSIVTPVEIRYRRGPTPPPQDKPENPSISILQYDPALESVIGPSPTHALVLSSVGTSAKPFFHRGCIYVASRNELWTTSAPLAATDPSRPPTILMSKVTVTRNPADDTLTAEWAKLRPPPTMPMPASGCAVGDDRMVWCSQGTTAPGNGGVFFLPAGRPPQAVASTYHGRDFNSPHSAAVSSRDGGIWFTDPCCGHEQDFRGPPQLPPQIYRCDAKTGEVRAMADGFVRPTGIAVDEDCSTIYIADAGGVRVDGSLDLIQPRSIYAFDIVMRNGAVFLANRRMFALVRRGAPMHLMCEDGNVWAACGDGVEIWNSGGSLLGVIQVPGGVISFCRGPENILYLCAGQSLWVLYLSGGRGDYSAPSPEMF
ncbi:Putative six-bladed beta-propeller, TolB, SMP-30/Gluconolactonase/LRE-like region [Colletotrichum destructivum]|uniref:Six-bladed beta-propeller, TolB, SMP-30/Gluconolactonase/LRE-like region n=1 Tax=Colletotrichum destructivum TaxID=34406 RepID=A0AAX4IR46_9PEZI|nr:Putative six-bladed beta-propeller, TolB, SMP-30/Gluconolactonase/LRE-like region [Colletotrichum destructivum]